MRWLVVAFILGLALSAAAAPDAPTGFELRVVHRLPGQGVRVTGDPTGRWVYVLCLDGSVDRYDADTGDVIPFVRPPQYLNKPARIRPVQGLCFDQQQRMYLVVNRQDDAVTPHLNRVTIYRSEPVTHGGTPPTRIKPWLETSYPWGINAYNHGVNEIVAGPDGMLYVSSGSRTDANEDSDEFRFADGGEVALTACLWRLDPSQASPTINIHARGMRNSFGLCFDDQGRLWGSENGPNRDAPEELNLLEAGHHYGFPYQFSDLPRNPYPHVGPPPEPWVFTPPIVNHGPDGGGTESTPLSTFNPHSSPAGLTWLGQAFSESLRGKLLVVRFGNQIGNRTVGYDALLVDIEDQAREDGRRHATVTTWMSGLARPLDVWASPTGRIYIVEHCRETPDHRGGRARWSPGRLLELRPTP